jgi:hypothetical protein
MASQPRLGPFVDQSTATSELVASRAVTLDAGAIVEFSRQCRGLTVEVWLTASGTSMLPTLSPGARVLLSMSRTPRVGDVVLVERCGQPVLHRAIRRTSAGGFVTLGDACPATDPVTSVDPILAVALAAGDTSGPIALVSTIRFGLRAFLRGSFFRARALARAWHHANRRNR